MTDQDDTEARRLPTLAIDGPWLLKREVPGELRVWVHEFSTVTDMRRDAWVCGAWVTVAFRIHGKWEGKICQ